MSNAENNKRIAKNTALLYVRMLFIMAVSLYTSRVILQALGVTDFGIYNVVGGVVAMFNFISVSLSGASSRFITFALGKGDEAELRRIFNCVVTIHYLIAAVIFVLAETVGLWFVMTQLVIPPERMTAAFWVYQSAVVSMTVMLASTPFNALIIAYERMSAFAYVSIFDAVARLGIVLLLFVMPFDKLITYALLVVVVQLLVRLAYTLYCRRHFVESHYRLAWDRERSREIFQFSGWTLSGNLAAVGYTQGLSVLQNLFFGPIVNAAQGIAAQVQAAVNVFFTSFQSAVKPQITKSWASGDLAYMHQLVLSSSRYSFYLMLLISLPIFFETEYILCLWLGQVPAHTVSFVRLMILVVMNYTLRGPTLMAIHATGDLKKFQLIESSILLTVVPITYVLLKFAHISPEEVFITYFCIEVLTQLVRVWIVYPRVGLARRKYLTKVLWPIGKVCVAAWVLPCLAEQVSPGGFAGLCWVTVVCLLSVSVCMYVLGMGSHERQKVRSTAYRILSSLKITRKTE